MTNKEFLLSTLKTAFKTITPWKKRDYGVVSDINHAYTNGWNACIKEIKKNRVRYIKFIEGKIKP